MKTTIKIEKPRKYFGDSMQDREISQEECKAEVVKLDLHYIKIALEKGEGGKIHFQFYFETRDPTTLKAIRKKWHKNPFWNNAWIQVAASPKDAIKYPGNLDFVSKDGKPKGGSVFWCFEIGEPYKDKTDGQKWAQKKKWADSLKEIKEKIEAGADLFEIWNEHFSTMCSAHRPIEKFYEISHAHRKLQAEYKRAENEKEEEIRALWAEFNRLSDENSELKAKIYALEHKPESEIF